MTDYLLACKPAVGLYGQHDPSAVLFADGTPVFGVEEERYTRDKHATETFPEHAIRACLEHRDLEITDLDRILLPYDPSLRNEIATHYLTDAIRAPGLFRKLTALERTIVTQIRSRFLPTRQIEARLESFGTPLPPIETVPHHRCHAASAFHPSGFDEAVVLTVDAKGEYDSTVVWHASGRRLKRIRTYDHPNSLGLFFATVTEYLGYRMFNGEGKVMGLAPLRGRQPRNRVCHSGADRHGRRLRRHQTDETLGNRPRLETLEDVFGRPRHETPGEYGQWEKDLAYTAQKLLEETVVDIAEEATERLGTANVALAGGVVLNCKLNKRIRESPAVHDMFVQPVAHDAGLALGAGWSRQRPAAVDRQTDVYLGPEYETDEIRSLLETNKLEYAEPDDLERYVAERLAAGDLVGWFQGRMEMGPRALGARSILADPRSADSRDRVNRFVKHRETWRPFAPSMLESAADRYLDDGQPAPFMIEAYDGHPEAAAELEAVLHPADDSTRPQTVRED